MAEKEERILIEKRYSAEFPFCVACWTRNGKDYFCSWGGEDTPTNKEICEKKCPYDNSISRQEAIERMAKALVEYEKTNNPNACEWSDLKERAKDIYRERSEAALNALLGGK